MLGECPTVVMNMAIGGGGGGIAVSCVVSRRLVVCCDGGGLVSCAGRKLLSSQSLRSAGLRRRVGGCGRWLRRAS